VSLSRSLLEQLWPMEEPIAQLNPPDIFARYQSVVSQVSSDTSPDVAPVLLDACQGLYEAEEKRRAALDAKATVYISTSGVASAFALGLFPAFLQTDISSSPLSIFALVLYGVSIVYFTRSVIRALRVHGKVVRYCVGPDDLLPQRYAPSAFYQRHLATRFLAYTIENYKINNKQTDSLSVGQRSLRNAVLVFLVVASIILVGHLPGRSTVAEQRPLNTADAARSRASALNTRDPSTSPLGQDLNELQTLPVHTERLLAILGIGFFVFAIGVALVTMGSGPAKWAGLALTLLSMSGTTLLSVKEFRIVVQPSFGPRSGGVPLALDHISTIYPFPSAAHHTSEVAVTSRIVRAIELLRNKIQKGELGCIVLVGRADRRGLLPAQEAYYGSNEGLAAARAVWVRSQIGSVTGEIPIMVLSAGPNNVGLALSEESLAIDRSVDVYGCGRK
jgi:hypothetical protein